MSTATSLCTRRVLHRKSAHWLAAAGVYLTGAFSIASAQVVSDRFVCELGTEIRSIELTFLNEANTVPCEIRETREDGRTRTLWRATFDVSFCQRQMDTHRAKMDALGWPCESAPDASGYSARSNASPRLANSALENAPTSGNNSTANIDSLSSRALKSWDARNAAVTNDRRAQRTVPDNAPGNQQSNAQSNGQRTEQINRQINEQRRVQQQDAGNTPARIGSVVSLQVTGSNKLAVTPVKTPAPSSAAPYVKPALASTLDSEVLFIEDRISTDLTPSDRPSPPDFLMDPLSPESLQQFDDWLIYLSAQSMASIRQVIGDQESFNNYVVAENLKSDNIYTRLQNRIEFLQSLVQEQ